MLLIGDILVSEDLFKTHFVCNLDACKGACCWEGDWGAPLDREEVQTLKRLRKKLRSYLTSEGNQTIDQQGSAVFYKEPGKMGTPLVEHGACAYLVYDDLGRGKCGIELAHEAGVTSFKKPISCHLYPLRYEHDKTIEFKALNYDIWDICAAACARGEKLRVPLYEFVKEGLIRKFGSRFYDALREVALDLTE